MKGMCNIDWWVESWSCDSQGSLSKVLESGGTRRGHHTKICGQRCQEEGQHLQRAWGRDEFGELCLTIQRQYSQSLWTKKADGKRDA